jgi:hypothetical protein
VRLPDEVKAWRKAERTRLLAERTALPNDQRRAARACRHLIRVSSDAIYSKNLYW